MEPRSHRSVRGRLLAPDALARGLRMRPVEALAALGVARGCLRAQPPLPQIEFFFRAPIAADSNADAPAASRSCSSSLCAPSSRNSASATAPDRASERRSSRWWSSRSLLTRTLTRGHWAPETSTRCSPKRRAREDTAPLERDRGQPIVGGRVEICSDRYEIVNLPSQGRRRGRGRRKLSIGVGDGGL
jgi:hypothetical protein